jgi:hypothetical protein
LTVTAYEVGLDPLDSLTGVDSVCLFVADDVRPLQGLAGLIDWRLCGGLSRVLLERFFTGAPGDKLLFPSDGRLTQERMFAFGLGHIGSLTRELLAQALFDAARTLRKAGVRGVALELPGGNAPGMDDAAKVVALNQHFLPEFKGDRVAVFGEKGLRQQFSK